MKVSEINAVLESLGDVDDELIKKEAANAQRSETHKAKSNSDEARQKLLAAHVGAKRSEEAKTNMRAAALKKEKATCVHCGKVSMRHVIIQFHNDKCKQRPNTFTELFDAK